MRFVHDNLNVLLIVMIVIAAIICWFNTAAPTLPKLHAMSAEPWSLPKLPEHDSKKSVDSIMAHNFWGIQEVGKTDKPIEPEWHVLGIAMNGKESFILLAYEGKPVEKLVIGDALPDGSKIIQIENDRFFIMTPAKKKIAFGIYKNEPAK